MRGVAHHHDSSRRPLVERLTVVQAPLEQRVVGNGANEIEEVRGEVRVRVQELGRRCRDRPAFLFPTIRSTAADQVHQLPASQGIVEQVTIRPTVHGELSLSNDVGYEFDRKDGTKRHLAVEFGRLAREDERTDGRAVAVGADHQWRPIGRPVGETNGDTFGILFEGHELVTWMDSRGVVGPNGVQERTMQVTSVHRKGRQSELLGDLSVRRGSKYLPGCVVAAIERRPDSSTRPRRSRPRRDRRARSGRWAARGFLRRFPVAGLPVRRP